MARRLPPSISSELRPAGPSPLRIGISSCLLGEAVRWDGGHKRDRFIADSLSRHVEFVPICPELEAGMGVPREAVRLIGSEAAPRMVGLRSGKDWTTAMRDYALSRVRRLRALNLCGYVLKKDSPSCGMERVRIHSGKGPPSRKGIGLFARELQIQMPLMPLEEEGRLQDVVLRENFIERVFAYRRLKDLLDSGCRRADLVAFHTAHRYLLLSHSPRSLGELDPLVAARAKAHARKRLGATYAAGFMQALRAPATVTRHHNVLRHAAGYLEETLDATEMRELQEVLEHYRSKRVPLGVPLMLLKRLVVRHRIEFLRKQIYLDPHPVELTLRNQV